MKIFPLKRWGNGFLKIIKTASGEPLRAKSWEWAITNLFHGKLALLCRMGS